jgi:LCP family protein required for cell wall assembly
MKKNHGLDKALEIRNQHQKDALSPYEQGANFRPSKTTRTKRKLTIKQKALRVLIGVVALFAIYGVFFIVSYNAGTKVASQDPNYTKIKDPDDWHGVQSANGAENILLIGNDRRSEDQGRSDAIMILQLNGPDKKPKLISIMRDSYVTIPNKGTWKINAAYAFGGAELLRETIADCFGIQCRYYAIVDFTGFEKVVDVLFPKGLELDAEKAIDLDGVQLPAGKQIVDGHQLLQYARFRHDAESDFGRVRRQQQVINLIMTSLKKPGTAFTGPKAIGAVSSYVTTDIPNTFIWSNAVQMLFKGNLTSIDKMQIPIEGSWSFYDSPNDGSALAVNNEKNTEAAKSFLNGGN